MTATRLTILLSGVIAGVPYLEEVYLKYYSTFEEAEQNMGHFIEEAHLRTNYIRVWATCRR